MLLIVPRDYRIRANMSNLAATVVSNSTSGTVRIPFTVIVDREFFGGSGFLESPPDSGAIVFTLATSGFTLSSTSSFIVVHRSLSSDAVEVVNDPVRGTAYVVRDVVEYPYSLSSPVTAPLAVPFVLNAVVEGLTFQERLTPFILGSAEIIPPGKSSTLHNHYPFNAK